MTDDQFTAWLSDPSALRITLVEVTPIVGGTPTTRYLSTVGYTTGAADTPANTPYLGVVAVGVKFTEKLSLTGAGGLSAGDIEIENSNGAYDSWLNDVWTNCTVQAWIGDARWARADFRMIFNGVSAGIDSRARDKLNIKLRDKLQRLNAPCIETKLSDVITDSYILGVLPDKNATLPLGLGEVHNVMPLLTNPTTLEYQVHAGAINAPIEVRDNGVPVVATWTASTGKFTLAASPAGAITVSFQGAKPTTYTNTAAGLVQLLATNYGKAYDRFTSADLDATNLAAFDTAHPQPMGLYIGDRTNVLDACNQLASSIGAQIAMSRLGQLRMFQIDLANLTPTFTIPEYLYVERSLQIVQRPDVQAAVKLGFCKNWTVQEGLQTAIPAQHKDLFATEWLTETVINTGVQSTYKLFADPAEEDGLLLRRADANAEAARRLALWSTQCTVYQFEGYAPCLNLQLGQAVSLVSRRFNLQAGVTGLVVSLEPDWQTGHVVVQVLVSANPPTGTVPYTAPTGSVVNDRDVQLGAASSRFGDQGAGVILSADSAVYRFAADGTPSPATIKFTAQQLGAPLTVTWTSTEGTLTGTGDTRMIDVSTIAGVSFGVTASVTVGGHTYTSTFTAVKIVNTRSAGHFYVTAAAWSDATASAACPGGPMAGDVVTIYNGSGTYAMQKIYSGTAWSVQGAVIDGTLLVTGSVTTAQLSVAQLSAITATIGTLRTATTGGRAEIKDNLISVFDGSNAVRVKLGNLLLS